VGVGRWWWWWWWVGGVTLYPQGYYFIATPSGVFVCMCVFASVWFGLASARALRLVSGVRENAKATALP